MTTPEETADAIASEWAHQMNEYYAMRDDIAAAIRSAIEAEREACAQIAIQHARLCEQRLHDPEYADMEVSLIGGAAAAAKIEGAIHARSVACSAQERSPKTPD